MSRVGTLHKWYHRLVARGHARRLQQPAYPFAGTVHILRRMAVRLDNPTAAHDYCQCLPNNMYCHVDARGVGWWVVTEHVLWMAKVDRETLDVAFAACSSRPLEHEETNARFELALAPLYVRNRTPISWEARLRALGVLSSEWMRKEKQGVCFPGLEVTGKSTDRGSDLREFIRTPLRLQRPQRLDIAVPLILHGLWSTLRSQNMIERGEVAEAWQLACALADNPWESWQTVDSGRLSDSAFGRPVEFFNTPIAAQAGASVAFVDSTFYLDNHTKSHPTPI